MVCLRPDSGKLGAGSILSKSTKSTISCSGTTMWQEGGIFALGMVRHRASRSSPLLIRLGSAISCSIAEKAIKLICGNRDPETQTLKPCRLITQAITLRFPRDDLAGLAIELFRDIRHYQSTAKSRHGKRTTRPRALQTPKSLRQPRVIGQSGLMKTPQAQTLRK